MQLSRAWEQIRLEPKRRPRSEPRGARRRVLEAVTNPAAAVVLTKVGPKTVNNHLGVLGSLFSAATRWGYCEVNPVLSQNSAEGLRPSFSDVGRVLAPDGVGQGVAGREQKNVQENRETAHQSSSTVFTISKG